MIPYANPEQIFCAATDIPNKILTNGPKTREFEAKAAEFLGSKYAVATSSGTVALYCVYRALGLAEKRVIMPSYTWHSTAEAALMARVKPVFVDIDRKTFCLDPVKVSTHFANNGFATSRNDISAIVAVDCFGCPAEYELLRHADIPLVVDSAHSFGGRYRGNGVGENDIHCFSLSPTKVITANEGGLITCNDESFAHELRKIRRWAGRMTEFNAACATLGLQRLPKTLKAKANIAYEYSKIAMERGWRRQVVALAHESTWKDVVFVLHSQAERDALRRYLEDAGIETKIYFVPCHTMPHFAAYERDSLDNTDFAYRHSICLPSWPGVDLEYILGVLDRFEFAKPEKKEVHCARMG